MLSLRRSENIDFKLLFIAVFIIPIWFFVIAQGAVTSGKLFLFITPFAFAFYIICFFVNHKFAAIFYFASLFIGIKSIPITNLGNLMLSDVLFFGLFLSFLISNTVNKEDIRSPIFISLLIFCGFAILSGLIGIPFMQDTDNRQLGEVKTKYIAVLYIFRFIQLPIVYLFIIDSMKKTNTIKNIVIIGILLQILIVLLQIFVLSDSDSELNTHASGTLDSHHMFVALYMMTSIPLFMGYMKEKKEIFSKVFWIFIVFISMYIIVASAARSVLLGFIVSFAVFFLLNMRFNKKSALLIVASLVFLFIIYMFTPVHEIIERTFDGTNQHSTLDVSTFSRFFIWRGALNVFENSSLIHKLIGNGPGSFAGLDLGIVIWGGVTHSSGAHNNFLHVLVETGIIGLILFLSHFAIISFQLLKRKTFVTLVFVCITIGLLASGIPQETFWMQRNYWLYYITILAIVVAESSSVKLTNTKIL